MEVTNLPSLPTNLEPESAVAPQTQAAKESEGSFFAQMDQIWNTVVKEQVDAEEKAATQGTNDTNPLTMLMNALMMSGIEPEPLAVALDPSDSPDSHPAESNQDFQVVSSDQTSIPLLDPNKGASRLFGSIAFGGEDGVKKSSPSEEREQSDNVAAMDSLQNPLTNQVASAGLTPLLFKSESALDPAAQPELSAADRASMLELQSRGNSTRPDSAHIIQTPVLPTRGLDLAEKACESSEDAIKNQLPVLEVDSKTDSTSDQQISKDLRNAIPMPSHGKSGSAADLNNAGIESPSVGRGIDNADAELELRNLVASELRQKMDPRSESRPVSSDVASSGNLQPYSESGSPRDSHQATAPMKSEIRVQSASENAGAGDTHMGQGNAQGDSASWIMAQGRPDSLNEVSKSKSQTMEKPQSVSPQILSDPVRLTEARGSSNPASSGNTALQTKEFILQLSERIQVQVRDGGGEIRIQLKPDGLGHLEIRAENTANGVAARIVAESSSVKNFLETNLHSLQQNLQDQGLKIDRIQVAIQDSSSQQSSSGFAAESGHAGSGHRGRTSNYSDLSSDQQEELAVDPATLLLLNPNIRFHTIA
jgi:flagellar hook-length control protein FliK